MKMRVKKLSFDGEHWWEPQDPEWIVEVDETKFIGSRRKPKAAALLKQTALL